MGLACSTYQHIIMDCCTIIYINSFSPAPEDYYWCWILFARNHFDVQNVCIFMSQGCYYISISYALPCVRLFQNSADFCNFLCYFLNVFLLLIWASESNWQWGKFWMKFSATRAQFWFKYKSFKVSFQRNIPMSDQRRNQ